MIKKYCGCLLFMLILLTGCGPASSTDSENVPAENGGDMVDGSGGGWQQPEPLARTLACQVQPGGCDRVLGGGSGSISIDATGDSSYTGQTICIQNGDYDNLTITGLVAAKSQPATIINCGGRVAFRVTTANQQSIRIKRSRYVRVTGSGSADYAYGILADAKGGASGVVADQGSSDIEVDHIEIEGSLTYDGKGNPQFSNGTGLAMKTYPKTDWDVTCEDAESWSYGNWVQDNTNIHDNYIHHVNNEGMYIGPSHFGPYTGRRISSPWVWSCTKSDDQTVELLEAELMGVRIVNNRVEHLGLDGIQVGAAVDSGDFDHNLIQNNLIKEFALQENSNHAHGIQLGSGTRAVVDGNWIQNTRGQTSKGFADTSMGDTWYFNNIITGVTDGIMLLGNSDINGGYYLPDKHIYHNTIVDVDVALYSFCFNYGEDDAVHLANNIFAGYETAAATNGGTGCLDILDDSDAYYPIIPDVRFVDSDRQDFHLDESSPALAAGTDVTGFVKNDYDGQDRSLRPFDLGAFIGDPASE